MLSFERVMFETSGLADPGPVLQTFATDRALGHEFHMQALICIVDAVIGQGNLGRMPEGRKQVALADRILITESDLADPGTTERLVERIAGLNAAPVGVASNGEIAPSFLLDEPPAARRRFDFGEAAHTQGLKSFSLLFGKPLSWWVSSRRCRC